MNAHTTIAPASIVSAKGLHLTWQRDPKVGHIATALRDLSAVNDRLVLLGIQTEMPDVREAASFIGSVTSRIVPVGLAHRRERIVEPTHGCCAAAALWGALDELRTKAIDEQQKADGFHAISDWRSDEADHEHHRHLSGEAPSIASVLSGERALEGDEA